MANSATVRKLVDNDKWVVVELTVIADSTAEVSGTLVDVSTLSTVPTHLSLWKAWVTQRSVFTINVMFDATTDVPCFRFGFGMVGDFSEFGGITDPKASGWTGDINYSTLSLSAGATGTGIFMFRKHF